MGQKCRKNLKTGGGGPKPKKIGAQKRGAAELLKNLGAGEKKMIIFPHKVQISTS